MQSSKEILANLRSELEAKRQQTTEPITPAAEDMPKKPGSIRLPPEAIALAKQLAAHHRRSVPMMIHRLLEEESSRIQQAANRVGAPR